MKIFTDIDKFNVEKPVITIGTFDGVHIGHKKLLNDLITEAKLVGGNSTVFTFAVHPRKILFPEQNLELLNSTEEKKFLLEKVGLENLILFDFSKEFSQLSANDFIEKILVNKLKIRKLIVGFNHQFGKDRMGNFEDLKKCADKFRFEVKKIEAELDNEVEISSTIIRNALYKGEISVAKKYLGYYYFISGTVIEGNKLGRKLGFPTANISIPNDKLLPLPGVYAVTIEVDNHQYEGMLNLGYRPTISSELNKKNIEVNIFDFKRDIYGKEIRISFVGRIRDELKFAGLDELKKQLNRDKKDSIKILSENLKK
jgi:riboflavin kinase/FMN adenylyltransferase